ncbi:MAG: hypothetical protein ACK5LJ_01195 [Paracoccus sp. (in: a-proteobacteria)]
MANDDNKKAGLSEAEKAARKEKNAANRARREANAAARQLKLEQKSARKADKSGAKKEKPAKQREKGEKLASKGREKGKNLLNADKSTNKPVNAASYGSFNILIVAQAGRLENEALLFVESLRSQSPDWKGRLLVAEPLPTARWEGHHTQISDPVRRALEARGAEIVPFVARHFGADYPYGNKIEALSVLPPNENFIFFDTDTLITGPIDRMAINFARPSASMRREGTWPQPPLYGPGYDEIWKSLYDRFDLDFPSSLDLSQPDDHWERYLYFNAGWFFGSDPALFQRRFLDWARAVKDEPGDELASQSLDPWLDQVVLPLVIHSLGGGRPGDGLDGLDGDVTCHWRNLPLLYAREGDRVVDVLEAAAAKADIKEQLSGWEPALRLIYQKHGRNSLRPAIDREHLPAREQMIRGQIRRTGWWLV